MTQADSAKQEQRPGSNLIRLGLAVLFLGLVFIFVYRYCEQAGPGASKSCIVAMIGAVAAGVAAVWPIIESFRKDARRMIMSVFIAGATRLLIGFVVVVIILSFMTVSLGWFLGCYGIFYAAFVAVDTWLIVCLFQGRPPEKDGLKDEYEYDAAGQRKCCRRDYQ